MTTHTPNLSALPAPWECESPEPLDARTVAEATGTPPARVEGLLGPFTVAHVTMCQDMGAESPMEWSVPDDAAVYVIGEPYLSRGSYGALAYTGDDYPDALDAAWDDVPDRYGATTAGRVLSRYAHAHGYTVRTVDLNGYSQSDWVRLAIVERVGGDRVDVESIGNYMRGDVYVVSVEVTHPLGGTVVDSVGGAYGDDDARRVTADLLADLMESVRADVRASA